MTARRTDRIPYARHETVAYARILHVHENRAPQLDAMHWKARKMSTTREAPSAPAHPSSSD